MRINHHLPMILPRLKTVVTSPIFFLIALFFGLSASGCLAADRIAPDRNILMIQGEPGSPEWKVLWDSARKFVRDEDYVHAVTAYSELVRIKPNIEEANWEYCKVLLKVDDYSTAAKIIGGLIDKDPNNSDYLLAGGAVALHWKNYVTAAGYYGRVYEQDPSGGRSDAALIGLATSLRNQGKKELAFPLLEQFSLRHPENTTIIHNLALDAHALGKNEKARMLYTKLLDNQIVADQVILEALKVFDGPGFEKKRSTLWLQYLSRHPDYMPFRLELTQFYMAGGEYEAALTQLRYLADNNENNAEFLLTAGELCQNDMNRPDRALFFFEEYLVKHPENEVIRQKVADIQSLLAKDFLSIVENDGAEQLWTDLAEITPSRLAIFRKMADLLEKAGQTEDLLQVLTIIFQKSSPEDAIALRIAHLYYETAQYRECLEYLETVKGPDSKSKSYFLLKGNTELRLGLEIKALASFEHGLALTPQDILLRKNCLELAGKLGNVIRLKSLFHAGVLQVDTKAHDDFVFAYLDLLAYNFMFEEYTKTYNWAKDQFADLPITRTKLDIRLASALRQEGKTRRGEHLLRQLLHHEVLLEDILFQLADNALADKNLVAAKSWYQALQKVGNHVDSTFSLNTFGCRMLLLQGGILQAEGKYAVALNLIEDYKTAAKKAKVIKELQPFWDNLEKQHCRVRYSNRDLEEAYQQCGELLDSGPFDPELLVLEEIIFRKLNKNNVRNQLDRKITLHGKPILTRLLALAVKEIEYQEYATAKKHLEEVLENYPGSVAANVAWAELMVNKGSGSSAVTALSQLIHQFPEEPYYNKKRIEVEVRRGMYGKGLELLLTEDGVAESTETLEKRLTSNGNTERLLSLARLLWGDKQQEKALQVYQHLLTPPVLELLSEKFEQKQINYHYLTRENTFWNSMVLMLRSEPDVLAELMSPQFLIDNRQNEAGKVVSELFEKYSWQKLIDNEYTARKAIFDRNYYYAEQSYKRLSKEDSTEGMSDLATIYGKIGKYRKEAQMYEAMQKSGTTSPELPESIERNSLQISPQSIFNAEYVEKDGRQGHIDVGRTTLGTSFWFTPDLNKDIQMFYTNNHFDSLSSEESTASNFLYTLATYEFVKAYELILGAGAEKFSNDSDTGFQYEIELKGQLDDYVNAYALLEKKQIYDTIQAIQQQITFTSFETGLSIETPIGLSFGGDLRHRYYNDGNGENRFHGYSSYTIFGDSIQLALRYDYQYLTNEDENRSSIAVEEVSNELFYWSPSFFTEHRINLHFQHDFLGYQEGTKKSMSYYAIDNAIGLEDNDNLSFTTNFNIFLEMSPHFLLKGNFTLSKSDDYMEKGLSMSLHYRW